MRARVQGFTLIELMIVIAIMALLAAIAVPAYQTYVLKGGRADGKAKLLEIMQAQERFFSQNQQYTENLGPGALGLGYPVAANAPVASNEGRYTITAQRCENDIRICVLLTATRQGQQAGDDVCGNLTLDSRGNRTESGSGTVEACW
jgi:type IV pilus assembly protein PilE